MLYGEIATQLLLGKEAIISLQYKDLKKTYPGIINKVKYRKIGDKHYQCNLQLVAKLWLLGKNKDWRLYHNQPTPNVIQNLFKQHTNYSIRCKLQKNYLKQAQLVQQDESVLEFIDRLCSEYGLYYYFLHDQDNTILLTDSNHFCIRYPKIINYAKEKLAENMQLYELSTIYHNSEEKIATIGYDYTRSRHSIQTKCNQNQAFSAEYYQGDNISSQQLQQQNQLISDRITTQAQQFVATGNIFGLQPGHSFKLNAEQTALQKDYLLTHSEIIMANPGIESEYYINKIKFIPLSTPYRLQKIKQHNQFNQALTAKITRPEQQNNKIVNLNRATIKFHWDRYANQSAYPVRIAQAWAGQNYGYYFMPFDQQEVLLIFHHGEQTLPVILGTLNNLTHMPVFQLPQHKQSSGFQYQQAKLIFNDLQKHQKIQLYNQGNIQYQVFNNFISKISCHKKTNSRKGINIQIDKGKYSICSEKTILLTSGSSKILIDAEKITIDGGKLVFLTA